TAGSIKFDGVDVSDAPAHRRSTALVSQTPGLWPQWTVFENIAFGERRRRGLTTAGCCQAYVTGDRAAFREKERELAAAVQTTAERWRVADLLRRKPGRLSGGEKQRVALARAMLRAADLYLFDEPFGALDEPVRRELRDELRRRWKDAAPDAALLFVTHDQDEALSLGDRTAVLRAGRIVQTAAPRELLDRPLDRWTATFLGSPPMRFLDGALRTTAGRTTFHPTQDPARSQPTRFASVDIDGPVAVGVRPTDVLLDGSPTDPNAGWSLNGTVTAATWEAGRWLVAVSTPAGVLAAATHRSPPTVGDAVRLYLPFDRLHWFDAETGRRLAAD
ncbi:MAG: ABC transporter ATP-binding protein, partial [Planctomycetia bacterium]